MTPFPSTLLDPVRTDWFRRLQPFDRSIVAAWDLVCPAITSGTSIGDIMDSIHLRTPRLLYQRVLSAELPETELSGKSVWTDDAVNWKCLYSYPTTSSDGDICYRMLYDAIGSPVRLHRWGLRELPKCPHCPQLGTTFHCYYECVKVVPVWDEVKSLISRILGREPLSSEVFYGFVNSVQGWKTVLANFLCNLARSTIHKYNHKTMDNADVNSDDVSQIFKNRLKYRISMEYFYSIVSHDILTFKRTWACEEVLCIVINGNELVIKM